MDIWKLLGSRADYIRGLYRTYNIKLKPGEGLSNALDEAESFVRGDKANEPPTESEFNQSIENVHTILALGEVLEICVKGNLNVSNHLGQISTGSTDYGTPDSGSGRSIYYKDFECELFVAATLLRAGVSVEFLDNRSDPRGDLKIADFYIEIKHPNSLGQLEKLLRKFNSQMARINKFGAFVVGIEDAFVLGDTSEFQTSEEYDEWIRNKRNEMELFGRPFIERASRLSQIGALVQTQSKVEIVNGSTSLKRTGNSCVFDHRKDFGLYRDNANKVAQVFNRNPRRYSLIQKADWNDNRR